jgi:hypothetical protein
MDATHLFRKMFIKLCTYTLFRAVFTCRFSFSFTLFDDAIVTPYRVGVAAHARYQTGTSCTVERLQLPASVNFLYQWSYVHGFSSMSSNVSKRVRRYIVNEECLIYYTEPNERRESCLCE